MAVVNKQLFLCNRIFFRFNNVIFTTLQRLKMVAQNIPPPEKNKIRVDRPSIYSLPVPRNKSKGIKIENDHRTMYPNPEKSGWMKIGHDHSAVDYYSMTAVP